MFHISSELVTDLFNPFALEFLGAFEHLLGVMDVVYVGQLPPAWGDRGHALSHFHQICRVSTPFVIWPNFAQKNVPNQMTPKISRTDRKFNAEIGVGPLYLSSILH